MDDNNTPPNRSAHLSHFNLKLNGAQADKEIMDALLECTVENSLHLPDVCTIRLHDSQFHWLDAPAFKEGTRVEVYGGEENMAQLLPLFNGEVTAHEMDLAAHGVPTVVIRCYDHSHRLHRGRQSRSFQQVKDSDVVQKVAGEMGFTAHVDATSQVHDWLFQNNQTNWEFLMQRAARNGFRMWVEGDKQLHFKKVTNEAAQTIALDWGKNMRSFRPRTALSQQVDEVQVRGWCQKTKQTILGVCKTASGTPQVGVGGSGGDIAREAFGSARRVITDQPVFTQQEADDLARSVCDDIGGSFLEADGLCYGQPSMKPGMQVEMGNIGQRFSGKYAVTATTHTYTPSEGYSTQFSVNGKRPGGVLALLDGQGSGGQGGGRAPMGGNIVSGVVTDNQDPEGMGRVKIKYPWLTEDHTSYWARIATPMAGAGRGIHFLPEVDDEVLVAFEHGDIRRPHVIGSTWNGKDQPVEHNNKSVGGGKVNRRQIRSRVGHTLLLDDTGGKGGVHISTAGGHFIHIDDAGSKAQISDKNGNKITLDAGSNSITIECAGDFTVKAQGTVRIEGKEIHLN